MAQRPLQLFTDFVAALSNADGFLPSEASQYATAIQVLCKKSPPVAQFFVREISNFLDAGESSGEESEPQAALTLSRKRKRVSDGAYIPPKSVRKVTGAAATTKDHDHPSEHTPEPSLTVGTGSQSADIAEETSKKDQIMAEVDRGLGNGLPQPKQTSEQLEANSSGRSALPSANAGSTEKAVSRLGPLSVTKQDASPAAEPKTDDHPQIIEINATRSVRGGLQADQANGMPGRPQPKDLDGVENSDSYEASTCVTSQVAQDEPVALLEPRDAGERVEMPSDDECSPLPRCMPSKDGMQEVRGAESMTASNRDRERPLHLITSSEETLVEPEGHLSAETGQHHARNSLPSTPKPQVKQGELPSPPTEDIPRGSRSAALMLQSETPSPSSPMAGYSFDDFIDEMVEVVGTLSHPNDQVPAVAHSTILKSLQLSIHPLLEATAPAEAEYVWAMNSKAWSGSMWLQYLEEVESKSQKSIIFKLIGCMGFAAWFEAGVAAYQATITTQRRSKKFATSFLLDSMLKEEAAKEEPRKRRKLSVDHPEGSLAARRSGPVSKIANSKRRSTVTAQLHKGRKLRKMVSKAGLCILLRPNIWDYVNSSGDELWETAAREFQHDPRRDTFLAASRRGGSSTFGRHDS